MGTNGVIAREDGNGRYHHWDSYPEGLGRALFTLRNDHFSGDTEAMLKVLIDDHPGGWSTIVGAGSTPHADFNYKPQWRNELAKNNEPVCHCHGPRTDWLPDYARAFMLEYTYILNGISMRIYHERDLLAVIDLDGPEPDWSKIVAVAA